MPAALRSSTRACSAENLVCARAVPSSAVRVRAAASCASEMASLLSSSAARAASAAFSAPSVSASAASWVFECVSASPGVLLPLFRVSPLRLGSDQLLADGGGLRPSSVRTRAAYSVTTWSVSFVSSLACKSARSRARSRTRPSSSRPRARAARAYASSAAWVCCEASEVAWPSARVCSSSAASVSVSFEFRRRSERVNSATVSGGPVVVGDAGAGLSRKTASSLFSSAFSASSWDIRSEKDDVSSAWRCSFIDEAWASF
ncbi:hypothetical protein C8R44DRAFT_767190 [Mycena epipterygia]|nr:hypothetical protein C8R44DRAFT_767190 [Mycena epipterygia]